MVYETKIGRFEYVSEWNARVSELVQGQIAGIGSDRQNCIYLLTRSHPAILILDKDGNLLHAWDDRCFVRPHGIHIIDGHAIFVVDDAAHAAYEFTPDLKLVHVFGTPGTPSDTGCINKDYKTVKESSGPFNYPTNVTSDESGTLYFSDGYGNARIHVFSPDRNLKYSFGSPGNDPGSFNLPHDVFCHENTLYVADRQNNRIQLFDTSGNLLGIWNNLIRPAGICLGPDGYFYVAECSHCTTFDASPSRITIFSSTGQLIDRLDIGCGDEKGTSYHTAHGITVDSEGSIYIGEVGKNYPIGYVGTQKYRRIG
ncbi:MAG: hypothetical protein J5496_04780 [Lachnospiraceae bacterium]|nr:hypothetical protein [Lachnospiraceae bacterium]